MHDAMADQNAPHPGEKDPNLAHLQAVAIETEYLVANSILGMMGISVNWNDDNTPNYRSTVPPEALSAIREIVLGEISPITRINNILIKLGVIADIREFSFAACYRYVTADTPKEYRQRMSGINSKIVNGLVAVGAITREELAIRQATHLNDIAKKGGDKKAQKYGLLKWSNPDVAKQVLDIFSSKLLYWPLRHAVQEIIISEVRQTFPSSQVVEYPSLVRGLTVARQALPETARGTSNIIPFGRPVYSVILALYTNFLEHGAATDGYLITAINNIMADTNFSAGKALSLQSKVHAIWDEVKAVAPETVIPSNISTMSTTNARKFLGIVSEFITWTQSISLEN